MFGGAFSSLCSDYRRGLLIQLISNIKDFMAKTNRSETKKPRNMVLRLLGPGLVTGAADDDPSGIATYSQAGAQFGYGLLWKVFLTSQIMIAIELESAHIVEVTGKALAGNNIDHVQRRSLMSLM